MSIAAINPFAGFAREPVLPTTLGDDVMSSPAIFSDPPGPDGLGTYRYTLWREVQCADDLFSMGPAKSEGFVMWIGLNPSTATETMDDPTLRRVQGFTARWGYRRMVMTNLFAYRATDPAEMKRAEHPEGNDNDSILGELSTRAALVVACWGNHGSHLGRADRVCRWMRRLSVKMKCLSVTGEGQPQHPLYLSADTELIPFQPQ